MIRKMRYARERDEIDVVIKSVGSLWLWDTKKGKREYLKVTGRFDGSGPCLMISKGAGIEGLPRYQSSRGL